jgi:hypothetical protein
MQARHRQFLLVAAVGSYVHRPCRRTAPGPFHPSAMFRPSWISRCRWRSRRHRGNEDRQPRFLLDRSRRRRSAAGTSFAPRPSAPERLAVHPCGRRHLTPLSVWVSSTAPRCRYDAGNASARRLARWRRMSGRSSVSAANALDRLLVLRVYRRAVRAAHHRGQGAVTARCCRSSSHQIRSARTRCAQTKCARPRSGPPNKPRRRPRSGPRARSQPVTAEPGHAVC